MMVTLDSTRREAIVTYEAQVSLVSYYANSFDWA
jgi:hypothetical protein